MANILPYRNRHPVNELFGDFGGLLDDFFSDMPRLRADTFRVDVEEKENGYMITADLPGIKKQEVTLSYEDGRLLIAVNRVEENEDNKEKNYICRERRTTSLQRALYLKYSKPEGINAKLEEGVLTITVQKDENAAKNHRIEVQ